MTNTPNKSLIDNWSLENVAALVDGDTELLYPEEDELYSSIGSLSSLINGILFYEKTFFLDNGFQSAWLRFPNFKKKIAPLLTPFILDYENRILPLNNNNLGADYYLLMSKYVDADLYISPERATKVIDNPTINIDNNFIELIDAIDKELGIEADKLWSKKVKAGIKHNFIVPSLTQYVLSQSTSANDILQVLTELKKSEEIEELNEVMNEASLNIDRAIEFQKEVDMIIKDKFKTGESIPEPWSFSVSILFFSIGRNFRSPNNETKSYITFLKNLISCRTESYNLKKHVDRLFKNNK
jgi:hypothetical protein